MCVSVVWVSVVGVWRDVGCVVVSVWVCSVCWGGYVCVCPCVCVWWGLVFVTVGLLCLPTLSLKDLDTYLVVCVWSDVRTVVTAQFRGDGL